MDNRKTKLIIIVCLCVAVIGLSIGYALLSERLNITGTAGVPAGKWDVVFLTDEIENTPIGKAECSIGTVSGTAIENMKVVFNKPGDACTFSIPVENTGTVSAKLIDVIGRSTSLTFLGSGSTASSDQNLLESNVVYEVNYGDTIIDGATLFDEISILEPGDQEIVTLRVTFNHDAEDIPKQSVTIGGLDREFVFNNAISDIVPEDPIQCDDGQIIPTPITKPNKPELMEGMIPVYYEKISDTDGVWKKADVTNQDNSWYNYTNQQWANAVTVVEQGAENTRSYYKDEAVVGTVIPMDDINTMWVWIPRYSYTIKSEDGKNYYGKKTSCDSNPTRQLPGEIDVKFISKSKDEKGTAQYTGDTASGYRTNEAFNFGGVKKSGIWVAKFEPTGSLSGRTGQSCTDTNCDISNVTVKPGIASIRSQKVSSFFFMSRSMQLNNANPYGFNATSGDLHMMKNDEWGAVAYLSQSRYGKYGNSDYTGANKEVYQNKSSGYITGNSNGIPSQSTTTDLQYAYNDMINLGEGQGQAGPGASTTGNITGIYDMSGGADEYVMGVLEYDEQGVFEHNGQIVAGSSSNNSGFKGLDSEENEIGSYDLPNEKYYNKYKSASPTLQSFALAKAESACNGGVCYGHALSETGASSGSYGWYGDYADFVKRTSSWFYRGGRHNTASAGLFYAYNGNGDSSSGYSCRLTFAP